jgi:hypothetical protein
LMYPPLMILSICFSFLPFLSDPDIVITGDKDGFVKVKIEHFSVLIYWTFVFLFSLLLFHPPSLHLSLLSSISLPQSIPHSSSLLPSLLSFPFPSFLSLSHPNSLPLHFTLHPSLCLLRPPSPSSSSSSRCGVWVIRTEDCSSASSYLPLPPLFPSLEQTVTTLPRTLPYTTSYSTSHSALSHALPPRPYPSPPISFPLQVS